jgi:hypothetical protein
MLKHMSLLAITEHSVLYVIYHSGSAQAKTLDKRKLNVLNSFQNVRISI